MPRVSIGPFSIEVPVDWTLSTVILAGPVTDEQPSTGMLRAKTNKPFQQNLVAAMEQVAAGETVESYVRRQVEGLRAAEVPRQEVREPERIKLQGGFEGLITEQVILGPGGERVRQMQLVSIKGGVAYTLITSHVDGEPFERVRDEFRQMLLSFS
jgi:hypothetical protein